MKYILVAEEALPVEGPQEAKTKSLLFEQNKPKILRYKTKFGEDWREVTVIQFIGTRRSSDTEAYQVPDAPVAKGSGGLSQAKKNDIKAMLKFMPPDDKTFMSNIAL